MASAVDLSSFIGRTGLMAIPRTALQVEVRVSDARSAFGRVDLLVTPTAGAGSDWVARTNIAFPDVTPARGWKRSK